jgi:uncharacterized protein YndB with AHSA1/START domain
MTNTAEPVVAQIAADAADATLTLAGDAWVLTMTRVLSHPIERVWEMLTEPALLAGWSPVVPDRTLDSAGPALSRESPDAPGVDAEVLMCRPPTELIHRWGADQLRWTLTRSPSGTRLVLEQTFFSEPESARYAAGWHICLAVLAAVLDGHDVARVVGPVSNDYGWDELRGRYDELLRDPGNGSGGPRPVR